MDDNFIEDRVVMDKTPFHDHQGNVAGFEVYLRIRHDEAVLMSDKKILRLAADLMPDEDFYPMPESESFVEVNFADLIRGDKGA